MSWFPFQKTTNVSQTIFHLKNGIILFQIKHFPFKRLEISFTCNAKCIYYDKGNNPDLITFLELSFVLGLGVSVGC